MRLPSSVCGSTTETVGLFRCEAGRLAGWLVEGLGHGWDSRAESFDSFDSFESLCRYLTPGEQLSRHTLVPWQDWTVMLTDGPTGTDVGMIPSLAARQLDCLAARATATDGVVMELFDPNVIEHMLRRRRSITAADDGGRWVFSQFGEPFDFEDIETYDRPRIRDRFTPTMLAEFLSALGVPLGQDLDLGGTILIERTEADVGAPQPVAP